MHIICIYHCFNCLALTNMSVDMSLSVEVLKRLDSGVQFTEVQDLSYKVVGLNLGHLNGLFSYSINKGQFLPPGTFNKVWKYFCHNCEGGTIGIYWVEARDPVKHLTMHRRTAQPHNKELSNPKQNSAEVEKLCVNQDHLNWFLQIQAGF